MSCYNILRNVNKLSNIVKFFLILSSNTKHCSVLINNVLWYTCGNFLRGKIPSCVSIPNYSANYISYSTSTSSSRLLIEFFQYIDAVAHFFMSNIDNFRRQKINTTAIMNKDYLKNIDDFMIHAICWLLFITCYLLLIII